MFKELLQPPLPSCTPLPSVPCTLLLHVPKSLARRYEGA